MTEASDEDTSLARVSPDEVVRFGNYVLLERLARGGMGDVYVAKHGGMLGAEKLCVVKTLRRDLTQNAAYAGRFRDEARLVVQLSHKNIGQVFDVGQVGDHVYLAMELIAGVDARAVLERCAGEREPLEERLALSIMVEVLEALSYAHRRTDPVTGESLRVVHRDVSPQNVMISFEGEVKLIDFGLAESSMTSTKAGEAGEVLGKLAYMAPEQARGEDLDHRTDLFAAAIVCFELCTGRRYYEGLDHAAIWNVAGKGSYRPPGFTELHKGLRKVLDRALGRRPEQRFADAAAFKKALDGYVFARGHRSGTSELRELMEQRFAAEIDDHRRLLGRLRGVKVDLDADGGEVTRLYAARAADAALELADRRTPPPPAKKRAAGAQRPGAQGPTGAAAHQVPPTAVPDRGDRTLAALLGVLLLGMLAFVGMLLFALAGDDDDEDEAPKPTPAESGPGEAREASSPAEMPKAISEDGDGSAAPRPSPSYDRDGRVEADPAPPSEDPF